MNGDAKPDNGVGSVERTHYTGKCMLTDPVSVADSQVYEIMKNVSLLFDYLSVTIVFKLGTKLNSHVFCLLNVNV